MDYETKCIRSEKLSAKEFLSLTPQQKANIISSRIIPPELGKNDFGKIEVSYKDTVYNIKLPR